MTVNDLRKRAPLSIAVAAALGMSGPAMAQMQTENPGAQGGELPTPLGGGANVLHDQTDNPSDNGAPDQDFEAGYDVYDAEGADDFIVPEGFQWNIQVVNTVGTTGTPGSATVDVSFHSDNGGEPGAVQCDYTEVVPVDTAGSFEITLPTACTLEPGHYWMRIQTNQNFAANGQHFWSNRTVADNDNAQWRNPGDGFGTGCTDWADMAGTQDGDPSTGCGVGGGDNPDFLFAISGEQQGLAAPVPALNRWGLSALVVALMGVSGWVLMRRRREDAV